MTNGKVLSAVFTLENNNHICNVIQNIFGEPIDSYWNGSHTWFDNPKQFEDIRFEWRLHPISGFKMPDASRPEELFELILEGNVDPLHYLEGLEVFPVDENDISIEEFNNYVTNIIGNEPDYIGYVDHEEIGNLYEQNNGEISIIKLLCKQI